MRQTLNFYMGVLSEHWVMCLSCAMCLYVVGFNVLRFRKETPCQWKISAGGSRFVEVGVVRVALIMGSLAGLVYHDMNTPLLALGCWWGWVLWTCSLGNVGINPPLPGNQEGVSWGHMYVRSLDFLASGLRMALHIKVLVWAYGLFGIIPPTFIWQLGLSSFLVLVVVGINNSWFWVFWALVGVGYGGWILGSVYFMGQPLETVYVLGFQGIGVFLSRPYARIVSDSGPWLGMLFLLAVSDSLALSTKGRAYASSATLGEGRKGLGISLPSSWFKYVFTSMGVCIFTATIVVPDGYLQPTWSAMMVTLMGILLIGREARVKRFVRSITVLEKAWGLHDPSLLHRWIKGFLRGLAQLSVAWSALLSMGVLWDLYACVYGACVLAPWYEGLTATYVSWGYRFKALIVGGVIAILSRISGWSSGASFAIMCSGYCAVLIYGSVSHHASLRWKLREKSRPPDLVRRWIKSVSLWGKPYTHQYITRLRDYGLPMGMWMALQSLGGSLLMLMGIIPVLEGWVFAQILSSLCSMGIILGGRLWLDKWSVKASASMWNILVFFGFFMVAAWGVKVNQGSILALLWLFFVVTNMLLVGALESWLKSILMSVLAIFWAAYGPLPGGYDAVVSVIAILACIHALHLMLEGESDPLNAPKICDLVGQSHVLLQRIRDSLRLVEKQRHYVKQFNVSPEKSGSQDGREILMTHELSRIERLYQHYEETLLSRLPNVFNHEHHATLGLHNLIETLNQQANTTSLPFQGFEHVLDELHRGLRYLAEQLRHVGTVLQHVSHPQRKAFDLVELLNQRLEGAYTLWGSQHVQGMRLKGPDSLVISGDVRLWSRSLDYMVEEGIILARHQGILSFELSHSQSHLDIKMLLAVDRGGSAKNDDMTYEVQMTYHALDFLISWILRHQDGHVYIGDGLLHKSLGFSVRV